MTGMSKEEIQAAADRAEARARFVTGAIAEGKAKAEVERLARLSPIAYDQEREPAAEKMRIRVATLDEAVRQERARLAKAAKTTKSAPASDPDELKRSAAHIIEHPKILDLFAAEFHKVIAGEAANGKLLYLVATSRLFGKPMNAAIKGTSAGGKSEIRKRVLAFFPTESVVSFTSLSQKALLYYDGDFAHKILSMGEATATEEQDFQDYLLRELMSEGRLLYPVPQKVGNEIVTITIEKNGPVAFLVTTTKSKLHPENETRMLSLEIDDSETQTRNVLSKVAQVAGLNHATAQVDHKPWQDFQRWLELGERRVVVPYACAMTDLMPPVAVRLRRDAVQVIQAIKAHALLHRGQRGRDDKGQIVADIEHDYTAVRDLLHSILAEGSGVAVNPATVETIEAVAKATAGMAESDGASVLDVARALKLDKSTAWRRLSAARHEGFIVNMEQRKGMPSKYRVTSQDVERKNILPDAAMLLEHFWNTCPADTPPESVKQCNSGQKAEAVLGDRCCTDGCNTVATVADDCVGVATPHATPNPLSGNGKSLGVAPFHGFSGGCAEEVCDDLTIPGFLDRRGETCAHCGEPGGTEWDYAGAKVRLHGRCERSWTTPMRPAAMALWRPCTHRYEARHFPPPGSVRGIAAVIMQPSPDHEHDRSSDARQCASDDGCALSRRSPTQHHDERFSLLGRRH